MKKYVLIIEDDKPLAEMTASMLMKEGMRARTVYNGEQALQALRTEAFDLILMDYKLPDLEGLELIREIKKNNIYKINKLTPVVVLTAYLPAESIKKQLLEEGVHIFLHKPFGRSELIDIIENIFLTGEIASQRELLTRKINKLDYKQQDPYFYLPFPVFYFDDQLMCTRWNHAALQQLPELVEETRHQPLTIVLENKTGVFSSRLSGFLKDSQSGAISFLDSLFLSGKQMVVQFTLQRLPDEISGNLKALIITPLNETDKSSQFDLNNLALIEHLPVGVLECIPEGQTFKIGYINNWFSRTLRLSESDAEKFALQLVHKLSESVRFIEETGKLQLRKNESVEEFSNFNFDVLMLPSQSSKENIILLVWLSSGPVLSENINSEAPMDSVAIPVGFLKQFSHDVRTPLNSILGFSKLLTKNEIIRNNEILLNDLKTIFDNGERLHLMIDELVDYFRIINDAVKKLPQSIEVNSIIQNMVNNLTFRFPNIKFNLNLEELPPIETDEDMLRKIIYHVLNNAVLYRNPEKDPIIRIESMVNEPHKILIQVEDNGIGMNRNDLEHIFEPFRRGEYSVSQKIKGFGLGMFLAKKFAEKLNIEIDVESQLNKGTRVAIKIPLF